MADDRDVWPPAPTGREEAGAARQGTASRVLDGTVGLLVGIAGYPLLFWGLGLLTAPLFGGAGGAALWAGPLALTLAVAGAVCLRVRRHSPVMALAILLASVFWFCVLLTLFVEFSNFGPC